MENGVHAPGGLRAMERIRRAYPTAPQRLVVPEFPDDAGNPLEIFYWPKTGLDEQKIDAREPKDGAERLVYTLILKAMDDQGRPLFQWGEARQLLQVMPYEVLARLVLIIMGARPNDTPTLDEVKREIQADPTSNFAYTSEPSSISP
jgi:hypothetical protein